MKLPFPTGDVEEAQPPDKLEDKWETEKAEAWKEAAKNEMGEIFPDGKFPIFDDDKPAIPSDKPAIPVPLEKEAEYAADETPDLLPSSADAKETKRGLTDVEKEELQQKAGWSDVVINSIGSKEEAEAYIKAGLTEVEINGKKCLVKSDIDWNQTDAMGRTNTERAKMGLAPLNQEGKPIELHHIGQHPDSPLAELTPDEHRGKGNDTILHDKTKSSEIDRQAFAVERSEHWRSRAQIKGDNS